MVTQYRIPVLEEFAWQPPVLAYQSAPPITPAEGSRYIVKPTGTGDFATHDNAVAWYEGAAWHFDTPTAGWASYDVATNTRYNFNGTIWTVEDDISGKADKVIGAVNGDVASLDATGNLVDSGIASADVSDAVSKRHTQNTDTGTTSNSFEVDSDSVLGKLKVQVTTGAANKEMTVTNEALTDDRTVTIPDATGSLGVTVYDGVLKCLKISI